jgi:hypothetical protein
VLITPDNMQFDVSIKIHNRLNLSDQVDMIGPLELDVIPDLPLPIVRHHSPSRGTWKTCPAVDSIRAQTVVFVLADCHASPPTSPLWGSLTPPLHLATVDRAIPRGIHTDPHLAR